MDYIFTYFNNKKPKENNNNDDNNKQDENNLKVKKKIIEDKLKDYDINFDIENNENKIKNNKNKIKNNEKIINNNEKKIKKNNEYKSNKIVYYNHNDNFDLQILQMPNRKNVKLRTKRPIDSRLPNIDNSINMIICSKSNKYNSIIISNLIDNSQFYKNYFNEVYLIGKNINKSNVLKSLTRIYSNNTFNNINNELVSNITKNLKNNKNNACIVLNNIKTLELDNSGKIFNLCSNYKKILSSKNGGGLLIFTNNNFKDFQNRIKNNINTYVIGKLNKEDYLIIAEELCIFYKNKDYLLNLFEEHIKEITDYLIFMIEGNNIIDEPCIYKNWEELIYPI